MCRFLLHTGRPIHENRCLWRPVCLGCLRQEMFATIRSRDVPPQWGTELPLCLWCIGSLHWKVGSHSVVRQGPVLSIAQQVLSSKPVAPAGQNLLRKENIINESHSSHSLRQSSS